MLYSGVLVSALYQSESAIHIHISPYLLPLASPSHPPYPTPLGGIKHRADLPVLCRCFPLAICFTFGSVYMSMPLSLRPSLPFPLPVSSPFSTSVSLFLSCPCVLQNLFFCFSRFHTYVLEYGICFSLSDFTLYDRL